MDTICRAELATVCGGGIDPMLTCARPVYGAERGAVGVARPSRCPLPAADHSSFNASTRKLTVGIHIKKRRFLSWRFMRQFLASGAPIGHNELLARLENAIEAIQKIRTTKNRCTPVPRDCRAHYDSRAICFQTKFL